MEKQRELNNLRSELIGKHQKGIHTSRRSYIELSNVREAHNGEISEMKKELENQIRNFKLEFDKDRQTAIDEAVDSVSAQINEIVTTLIHKFELMWSETEYKLNAARKPC